MSSKGRGWEGNSVTSTVVKECIECVMDRAYAEDVLLNEIGKSKKRESGGGGNEQEYIFKSR